MPLVSITALQCASYKLFVYVSSQIVVFFSDVAYDGEIVILTEISLVVGMRLLSKCVKFVYKLLAFWFESKPNQVNEEIDDENLRSYIFIWSEMKITMRIH